MKIWLIKLQRWDDSMTDKNQKETAYIAGKTMMSAVRTFLNETSFYDKPIWTYEDIQSIIKLPYALSSMER